MRIVVVNQGGVPVDEVAHFVGVAQTWLETYVRPCWPKEAAGSVITMASGAMHGDAPLVLAPNTTIANSLGYHTRMKDGSPISIVELDACRRYNQPWTIAATHEIAEMLVNPALDRFVQADGKNWPLETADPVTSYDFPIGGVRVANVTTPTFWGLLGPVGVYDVMRKVAAPLSGPSSIPHGGWMEWEEGGSYRNAWGADLSPLQIAYLAERRGRRFQLRSAL